MKKILLSIIVALISFSGYSQIVGNWKTIDDETGEAKSIVRIYKKTDGKYYGKIEKSLIKPENDLCVNCSGSMKNQPILGMEILKGLSPDGDEWTGGTITDPKNGKTYKCYVKINEDGNLDLRGYIGFSLLGRTQTWIKQ